MAYKTRQQEENQFLRKAFDTSYAAIDQASKFDANAAIDQVRSIDRRTKFLIVMVAAAFVAIVSGIYLTIGLIDYMKWVNRPVIMDRLIAPYELATRQTTLASGTGQYIILPEVGEIYTLDTTRQITNLLPVYLLSTQQHTVDSFAIRNEPVEAQTTVLVTEEDEDTSGTIVLGVGQASYITTVNSPLMMAPREEAINVVVVQYIDEATASAVMNDMLDYSRTIGHLGNFNLNASADVTYYYSSTRNNFSFTWVMRDMVFTVSASNWLIMDEFIPQLPLNQLTWTDEEPVVEEVVIEGEAPVEGVEAEVVIEGDVPVEGVEATTD